MKLKVINTGSVGNAYILENDSEALLIECGVNIKDIKQALNYSFSKLVACIVTHEHGDHAKAIKDVLKAGIKVFATEGTHAACGTTMHHRACMLKLSKEVKIGSFRIRPFHIKHDAAEPCGFLINHPETGNVLFLTDTVYSPYTFENLHNIIVEANYSKEIIDRKVREGASPEFLRNRILKSHLSLENCKELLKANDLSNVNHIIMIHLSDSNSNEDQFQREVQELTGKNVTVASAGMEINFNKYPF